MCDRRCERAGDACPFWCFDWWLLLVVGLGMLAVHPRCVRMLTSLLGRVLRREPLPVTLSYPIALGLMAWSMLLWALSSISLLCLASIFSEDLRPGDLGVFASIFAVGWLIGFFTAFAPNGIGIREGMFVLAFMSLGIPVADGVFIAMLSRLAIVAADVGCAGIGWLCLPAMPADAMP